MGCTMSLFKCYQKLKMIFTVTSILTIGILSLVITGYVRGAEPKELVWKILVRLGKEEGNGPTTFFRVTDIAVDSKSNFYVLDELKPAIQCFDSKGRFLRTITLSKGKGPGEIMAANKLTISHNDTLVLLEEQLRRLYLFDTGGKRCRTINLPETFPPKAAKCIKVDKQGNFWIVHRDTKKYNCIHIYSSNGSLLKSLVKVKPLDLGANWPLPFTGYFDWYRNNIIFLKENPYELLLCDSIGNILLKFQTDKSVIQLPKVIRKGDGFILPPFDKTEFVANLSDQYVLCELSLANKRQERYDLFDIKTGRFVGTCSEPIDTAPLLLAVKGNVLYAVTEEAGYPEVLVLRFKLKEHNRKF